ncbi:hypothetical protein HDV00_009605, partial [Rhizophlyctis rosea]
MTASHKYRAYTHTNPAYPHPQFHNYTRKTVEGLSAGLLFIWLFGDVSNLLGTILTNQLPTQKLTGAYFVILEIVLVAQFIWYKGQAKTGVEEEVKPLLSTSDNIGAATEGDMEEGSPPSTPGRRKGYGTGGISNGVAISVAVLGLVCCFGVGDATPLGGVVGRAMGVVTTDIPLPLCDAQPELDGGVRTLGAVLAWSSGLLYFFSRIPQILENHRTRSTEALSLYLFFFTVMGNLTYGLAIFLRFPPIDERFFETVLPYVVGSVGVLAFDL